MIRHAAEQSAELKDFRKTADGSIEQLSKAAKETAASARKAVRAVDKLGKEAENGQAISNQADQSPQEVVEQIGNFKITDFR